MCSQAVCMIKSVMLVHPLESGLKENKMGKQCNDRIWRIAIILLWKPTLTWRQTLASDADGQTTVKFGVLFSDDRCANIFEALVGTLRAAKKKKVIDFKGELLLQGVHDNVDVVLLKEWDLARLQIALSAALLQVGSRFD